jgi:alkanesulfonate monooxygenase SsuD/methylene tetrahydromethanopterin reductase-like flavin-dependent oxidoreductase (luciferase family)
LSRNAVLLSYFTEQPMSAYPEQEALRIQADDHHARKPGDTVLLFSNRFFDPVAGSRLYRDRLEHYRLAERVGFDAVMTNEHHTAPFSMQARCNITTSFAAAVTERVWILQLGNPLPLWDNPVQLAEETSMIDMLSGGRLISGIVRGGGTEQLANNVNPAYNRERFQEAHDLLIKAWTVPGPFRWEGVHYDLRVVNPWAVPLQKPHPRIFVPGVISRETVEFAARHAYPYVALGTTIEDTLKIWRFYDQVAAEVGYEAGPEHRGYLMRCCVAENEDDALRHARQYLWMAGEFTGVARPTWANPTGYSSWEARRSRELAGGGSLGGYRGEEDFRRHLRQGTIIAGTPDRVRDQIFEWMERTRPGTLVLWASDGRMNQEESLTSIRLMGSEVLPALRERADQLGLHSPFDINAPVSLTAGPAVGTAARSVASPVILEP